MAVDFTPITEDDTQPAAASVFADERDLADYAKHHNLATGDNGQGAWGDDTTSKVTPQVALPRDTISDADHGRPVKIEGANGRQFIAYVTDKMPSTRHITNGAGIDLNPAAARLAGHPGDGLAPVKWKFADEDDLKNTPVSFTPVDGGDAPAALSSIGLTPVATTQAKPPIDFTPVADSAAPPVPIAAPDGTPNTLIAAQDDRPAALPPAPPNLLQASIGNAAAAVARASGNIAVGIPRFVAEERAQYLEGQPHPQSDISPDALEKRRLEIQADLADIDVQNAHGEGVQPPSAREQQLRAELATLTAEGQVRAKENAAKATGARDTAEDLGAVQTDVNRAAEGQHPNLATRISVGLGSTAAALVPGVGMASIAAEASNSAREAAEAKARADGLPDDAVRTAGDAASNTALEHTAAALPAYMVAGSLAGKAAKAITPETAGAIRKFLTEATAATGANVAASAGVRAAEGESITPTMEGFFGADLPFALSHAIGAARARSKESKAAAIKEALKNDAAASTEAEKTNIEKEREPSVSAPEGQNAPETASNAPETPVFPPHAPAPQLSPDLQAAEQRFHEQLATDPDAAVREYQQRFGNVIDRDNARELFPEYGESREARQELGPATYRPAGMLADELFRRAVAEPDPTGDNLVVFNAGGPGVGKSMGVAPDAAQIVMDGTLSNYDKSRANIQAALDNGKDVLVNHTQRPFEEAMRNIIERAADPKNGRVVSLPIAAQGRIMARENMLRLADEHQDNPNFAVRAVDNTGNAGRPLTLDEVRQQEPENLDDLRARGKDYVNAYFAEHAPGRPELTKALRRRILGADADPEGGSIPGAGDRQPEPGGAGKGGVPIGAGSKVRPGGDAGVTPPREPTGTAHAVVDQDRVARGLPPIEPTARQDFGTAWDKSAQALADDPQAGRTLVDSLNTKPRALTDEENALLLRRQVEAQSAFDRANDAVNSASPETLDAAKTALDTATNELYDVHTAARAAGAETGRGLNARKMLSTEQYDLSAMLNRKRAANDGKPLTADQTEEVRQAHAKIAELEKKVAEHEKLLANPPAAPDHIRREARAEAAKPRSKRKSVQDFLDDQARAAHERIVARRGHLNAFGVLPQVADEAIIGASHLARGVTRFSEWSKKMVDDFGERITPHLSRIWREAKAYHAQSRRELSGPGPTLEEQMLARRKRAMEDRTAELKARIAGKDYVKPVRAVPAALDAEGQRLQAAHQRAKNAFDMAVERDRLKNRPVWQRAADTFVKIERMFKLTGSAVLAKLSGAAMARLAITPVEEAIGGVMRHLPVLSRVAARAPREGGMSFAAERAALGREGFLKGVQQIPSILGTGRGHLDVLHGQREQNPHNVVLDLPGAVHSAIKSPVKYAEFARATAKRTAFYQRQGLDIENPLVKARIATESYMDAQRSIFMQENFLNAGFRNWVQGMERSKHQPTAGFLAGKTLRFLIPFLKVPSNIIGEGITYATGLESGALRLTNAMRKGLDTLEPEQADLVMRELKKGSLGTAVLALGFLGYKSIGGLYQEGEKRDKKDVAAGDVKIFGVTIPKLWMHAAIFEVLNFGATIRRYSEQFDRRTGGLKGIGAGAFAALLGVVKDAPYAQTSALVNKLVSAGGQGDYGRGQFVRDNLIPAGIQEAARRGDKKYPDGTPVKRAPQTLVQHIEMGIPDVSKHTGVKLPSRSDVPYKTTTKEDRVAALKVMTLQERMEFQRREIAKKLQEAKMRRIKAALSSRGQ